MSTTVAANPYFAAITIPTGNTAINLKAALLALDADAPTKASGLKISYDIGASGNLYIGNSNVDTTHWGQKLVGSQYYEEPAHGANDIPLQDIWLVTDDGDDQLVGVTIVLN